MGVLHISLLGGVRVAHLDGSCNTSRISITRTVQALFSYLVLRRRRAQSRDTLAGLFWGDYSEERARSCLNTALWRLRSALESNGVPRGTYLLTTSTGEIAFNPSSDYWLDVAILEESAERVVSQSIECVKPADVERLESALKLYTGDLLEGFHDDWALRERERLHRLYLNSLAYLTCYYRHRGAYEEGLSCGQRLLDEDPLQEEIHREMMRLHLAGGRRVQALQQYQACRRILSVELGVSPMKETQELYAEIAPPVGPHPPCPVLLGQADGLQQALRQLHAAMQALDEAKKEVGEAIRLVEQSCERPSSESFKF